MSLPTITQIKKIQEAGYDDDDDDDENFDNDYEVFYSSKPSEFFNFMRKETGAEVKEEPSIDYDEKPKFAFEELKQEVGRLTNVITSLAEEKEKLTNIIEPVLLKIESLESRVSQLISFLDKNLDLVKDVH